jgi:hypothetical protein
VELELGEYNETAALREKKDTAHAVEVAEEVLTKSQPKIRKLSKKLLLVAATDALDEPEMEEVEAKEEQPEQKKKKSEKPEKPEKKKPEKKVIIIESDEESD